MQITEAQLFEMLGRLFAEIKVLTAENEALKASLQAWQEESVKVKREKTNG